MAALKKAATKKVADAPEAAKPLLTPAKVELGRKRVVKKAPADDAPF